MATAAVIIPTIAARKTKRPVSRAQVVSEWGTAIRQIVRNSVSSIRETGFEPLIVLVNNKDDPAAIRPTIQTELDRLPAEFRSRVHVIERPKSGWMGSIIAGSDHAVKDLHADAVVSMADDFETEAKHLKRLVTPLRRKDPAKRADFTFARWDRFGSSFPPAQYLKETMGSRVLALANPRFRLKAGEDFFSASKRAVKEAGGLQSFTGLMAMNADTFREAKRFIDAHFVGGNFGHSGLDPIVVLSALKNPNRRLEGVEYPRRFEHYNPKGKELAKSRGKMLEGALLAMKHYLTISGQHDKLAQFDKWASVTNELIGQAPRTWPRGNKKRFQLERKAATRVIRKAAAMRRLK
jgi:hypothetical protein